MAKKEDPRLQGLCVECTHRNSCPDAKRYLNMIGCSDYRPWKKGYTKKHCASEERNLIPSHSKQPS